MLAVQMLWPAWRVSRDSYFGSISGGCGESLKNVYIFYFSFFYFGWFWTFFDLEISWFWNFFWFWTFFILNFFLFWTFLILNVFLCWTFLILNIFMFEVEKIKTKKVQKRKKELFLILSFFFDFDVVQILTNLFLTFFDCKLLSRLNLFSTLSVFFFRIWTFLTIMNCFNFSILYSVLYWT